MKIFTVLLLTGLLCLVAPEFLSAQPGFPSPPDQVPLDGGLTALAVGGAAYAMHKIRNRKAE